MASRLTESRFATALETLSECSRTCTWDTDADIREVDATLVECARRVCAELCDACAAECEKHEHHEHCRICAESCRRCAEQCRQLAA